jgi:hypothetical protein
LHARGAILKRFSSVFFYRAAAAQAQESHHL